MTPVLKLGFCPLDAAPNLVPVGLLAKRIKRELVRGPAFNEDISTVNGQPHGNTPYADYSVYIWLRAQTRTRLGHTDPDPVGIAIDEHLDVVRDGGFLRLEPASAKAAP